MRPVIRFALRGTHQIQDIIDLTKELYVELAAEELSKTTEKINVSRISVLTGVNRKDVTRIYKQGSEAVRRVPPVLSRLVTLWESDNRFRTSAGKPRTLTYLGDESEFNQLARSVTQSVGAGTLLFEIVRSGIAERTPRGLKLVQSAPRFHDNPERGYAMLASDIATLIDAAEENITERQSIPNLHLHTEFDNIIKGKLPEIRNWLLHEGRTFHRRVRAYLATFDKDVDPTLDEAGGARVVVSAAAFAYDDDQNSPKSTETMVPR